MKRLFALLLAISMTFSLIACSNSKPEGLFYEVTGNDPAQIAMTVEGKDIPLEWYYYWAYHVVNSMEYTLAMYNQNYGLYSECFNKDGTINWDSSVNPGVTLREEAVAETNHQVATFAYIQNLAKNLDITLTADDKVAIENEIASAVEEVGGQESFDEYMYQLGISLDSYRSFVSITYLINHILEAMDDETSDAYMPPEDYEQSYVFADHILLATVDITTGEALSEDEINQKRATMETLLTQLQETDSASLETVFTNLANDYSEDTGRETNPEGYVFTFNEMVAEFEEAAFALQPGEISDIIETDYGYHIILRKTLADALENNDDMTHTVKENILNSAIAAAVSEANITYHDIITDFDIIAFYNDFGAAVMTRQAETGTLETNTTTKTEE